MSRETSIKIASVILFIHGFIELVGALLLLASINGFLSFYFQGTVGRTIFMAVLSAIFGSSRLIASYKIWLKKKWGIVFGIVLSVVTMIEAPSIYPFGVMDLLLSTIVLASLLHAWFGDEIILK
ncbi:MAG: hypothetical protein DRO23_12455 [Thermoprotei archaeon]|nr:MAG: hypothetical protein DRO23_12455 [Thermoprotei archaeon]